MYSRQVLRPLAEQLVEHLASQAGARIAVAGGDGGVLVAVLQAAGLAAVPAATIDAADPADVLAAVCTLCCDARTVAVLGSVARRLAAVVWDADDPPLHERALIEALEGEQPATSVCQDRLCELPRLVAASPALRRHTLHDVARFDGEAQLWHALVVERPGLAAALRTLRADALSAIRERMAANLASFTAADGTLRIPVTAALLSGELAPQPGTQERPL